MRAILLRHYNLAVVDSLMLCSSLGRLRLPNLSSTVEHHDFVTEQVDEYLRTIRIVELWWPDGEPPQCILPLGVDVRPISGKRRAIYDARYPNLWHRYEKFNYETLKDIPLYAEQGGYATTSDIKAGYHAILVPQLSTYYGFEWHGTVYVWRCLPFGAAPACRIFTEVAQVMFQPMRSIGVRLTSYIDDRMSYNETRAGAKSDNMFVFAVMAALGWYVSIDKCELLP